MTSNDQRLVTLVERVLSEFPKGVAPISSLHIIETKNRGRMEGLVGLTRYCCVEPEGGRKGGHSPAAQKITFYTELLHEISDASALGVLAHELAHAWLNEHASPEESKRREKQADDLARSWGYGRYLDALAAETEPA